MLMCLGSTGLLGSLNDSCSDLDLPVSAHSPDPRRSSFRSPFLIGPGVRNYAIIKPILLMLSELNTTLVRVYSVLNSGNNSTILQVWIDSATYRLTDESSCKHNLNHNGTTIK